MELIFQFASNGMKYPEFGGHVDVLFFSAIEASGEVGPSLLALSS